MEFDFQAHLGAAARSVSSLEGDGQPARAGTLSRGYAAALGASGGRGRNGPCRRARGGRAHNRVLHR